MPRPKGTPKTGGRAPGTPNKLSADNRAKLAEAFSRLGDVDGLVVWATDHPTEFYQLWGRTIPREVEVSGAEGKPAIGVVILPAVRQ